MSKVRASWFAFPAMVLAVSIASGETTKPPIVQVRVPEANAIAAGGELKVSVNVTVAAGYHVQANPPSEKYLIPTTLTLEPADGFTISPPIYPKGEAHRLEGTEEDLLTYDETFTIQITLKAAAALKSGDYVLNGKLRYQACDARSCFAPTNTGFELHVRAAPALK